MQFTSETYGEITIDIGKYANSGITSVRLFGEYGEPVATLSTNIPNRANELEENEFIAKTWSENGRISTEALASGLFEDTGKIVSTGFAYAQVWRIV